MVVAYRQRPPKTVGPGTRVGIRHSLPVRSDTLLPIAQSRPASRRARALRRLVHRIAARTVPDAQEPQKGRAPPSPHGQNLMESEPPRRLELGTGLELRECEWHQPPASIRRGLSQHWMPAMYRAAG